MMGWWDGMRWDEMGWWDVCVMRCVCDEMCVWWDVCVMGWDVCVMCVSWDGKSHLQSYPWNLGMWGGLDLKRNTMMMKKKMWGDDVVRWLNDDDDVVRPGGLSEWVSPLFTSSTSQNPRKIMNWNELNVDVSEEYGCGRIRIDLKMWIELKWIWMWRW